MYIDSKKTKNGKARTYFVVFRNQQEMKEWISSSRNAAFLFKDEETAGKFAHILGNIVTSASMNIDTGEVICPMFQHEFEEFAEYAWMYMVSLYPGAKAYQDELRRREVDDREAEAPDDAVINVYRKAINDNAAYIAKLVGELIESQELIRRQQDLINQYQEELRVDDLLADFFKDRLDDFEDADKDGSDKAPEARKE